MKAIVLKEYNSNLGRVLRSLVVEERTIRMPEEDEVLVKMDAAPCNPSDIAFLRGMYDQVKPVPVVPGFEGTGTVVATGKSPEAVSLLNKRVSCFSRNDGHGTWASYFTTKSRFCIPVVDKLPVDQAACLAINPFTTAGLMDIAISCRSKAIIQNAAAGQIGAFVRHLSRDHGIKVINTVRSDHQVQVLSEQGEPYVLNQKSETFAEDLKTLAEQFQATTAFDAVGGEMTGQLLNAMPDHSRVVLYGGLSAQPVANIDVLGVIFHNKTLVGFNLGDWINQLPTRRFHQISVRLQEKMVRGELIASIQARYPFDQVVRGLLQYVGHMSEGKVLFVP